MNTTGLSTRLHAGKSFLIIVSFIYEGIAAVKAGKWSKRVKHNIIMGKESNIQWTDATWHVNK